VEAGGFAAGLRLGWKEGWAGFEVGGPPRSEVISLLTIDCFKFEFPIQISIHSKKIQIKSK
jgi:hypothetical protein